MVPADLEVDGVVDIDKKKADGLHEETAVSKALVLGADEVSCEGVKGEGSGESEPGE